MTEFVTPRHEYWTTRDRTLFLRERDSRFRALWEAGVKVSAICEELRCDRSRVGKIRRRLGLPRRPGGSPKGWRKAKPFPSLVQAVLKQQKQQRKEAAP